MFSEPLATSHPVKSDHFGRTQDARRHFEAPISNFEASKIPYKRALVSLKPDISMNEDINKHTRQIFFYFICTLTMENLRIGSCLACVYRVMHGRTWEVWRAREKRKSCSRRATLAS